jgi:hypothetical protein
MTRLLALAALLSACGGATGLAEPLPAGCIVQPEHVRLQLCPDFPVAVTCDNANQTNPDRDACVGWGQQQVTGTAWCCQ